MGIYDFLIFISANFQVIQFKLKSKKKTKMAHKFQTSAMQSTLNRFVKARAQVQNAKLKKEQQHEPTQTPACDHNPKPHPSSILISCIDSRTVASRMVQTDPAGETYLQRNAGNLIPDYSCQHAQVHRPEEAAIDLACSHHHVDSLAVCGHSDCKAMNLVYDNRTLAEDSAELKNPQESVLKRWLMANCRPAITKYAQLEKSDFKSKLTFRVGENLKFDAYIDPENDYAVNDKFSQINALCQLENLDRYESAKSLIKKVN